MEEGRELAAVLERGLVERMVEAVVTRAELDPRGTSAALAKLRANPETLQRLEDSLGLPAPRATLALGGAIQLARAELAAAEPDLRARVPELVRWLQGAW